MSEERTEKPTARKKKENKKEGTVPRTQELGAWGSMLAVGLALPPLVSRELHTLRTLFDTDLRVAAEPSVAGAREMLQQGLGHALLALVLLGAGVAVIGTGAALAQGGFYLATKAVKPSFSKINPLKGAKRVFGTQMLWEGAKMLLKASIVAALVWSTVKTLMPLIGGLVPMSTVIQAGSGHVLSMLRNVALAGLVMAAADYGFQRFKVGKKARMTKDEVKREYKQTEGDPMVKAAIRSRQLAAARNRMMADIPQADVVLVNPCSRPQVYQSLGATLTAVENPVWAGLMATFCRRRGLSVQIIDAEAEGLGHDAVAERVRELNPVLAAVVVYGHQPSASTQIMTASGQVVTAIKETTPDQPVLMLGGHVAALPERTLREERTDYVAAGEGLYTLVALVEALQTAVPALASVPGLYYRDGGAIRQTPGKPLLTDLDGTMPGIAWDLLPMPRYRAHNWHCLDGSPRQPYAALYTTLGCPYHCSFCCIQAPFKAGEEAAGIKKTANSYRAWSPDAVIAQIDTLVNDYGVRNIKIADEMFILNRRHVLALCEGIIRRGHDLNLWAYARIDTIKEDMLETLRGAGFRWLALGIEAGAEKVRAGVDKAFRQDEVFEVVGRIRTAGIHVIGNYIFGLPEDDADTMQATLDLATELNCEFANFYSTMAYPGSALYDLAERENIPLPARWTGYAQHARDCLPLPTRHVTARAVLRFRDDAFQRYYTNPHYLALTERRFGAAMARHIRAMTAQRLERDLLSGALPTSDALLPTPRRATLGSTLERTSA